MTCQETLSIDCNELHKKSLLVEIRDNLHINSIDELKFKCLNQIRNKKQDFHEELKKNRDLKNLKILFESFK